MQDPPCHEGHERRDGEAADDEDDDAPRSARVVRVPEALERGRAHEQAERHHGTDEQPSSDAVRRPVADLMGDGVGGIDTRSPLQGQVAPFYPKDLAPGWAEGTGQVTGDEASDGRAGRRSDDGSPTLAIAVVPPTAGN